ncbi:hypothetical protein EJ08DRAFT_695316 [Tothia fuscella]|uniref:Uncharacterized protein n=1 Tax=Tothia fuscella TaxID=1048955 RepID=A0A9P4NVL8_9PEZI|nr:hypothetical protein EJ08DRAFT_695316 [Tothia fuscella]
MGRHAPVPTQRLYSTTLIAFLVLTTGGVKTNWRKQPGGPPTGSRIPRSQLINIGPAGSSTVRFDDSRDEADKEDDEEDDEIGWFTATSKTSVANPVKLVYSSVCAMGIEGEWRITLWRELD